MGKQAGTPTFHFCQPIFPATMGSYSALCEHQFEASLGLPRYARWSGTSGDRSKERSYRLPLEVWTHIMGFVRRPVPPPQTTCKWAELNQHDLATMMRVHSVSFRVSTQPVNSLLWTNSDAYIAIPPRRDFGLVRRMRC